MIFFEGGGGGAYKAKAISATFRKIPERNIDYFNLWRSSAPIKVQCASERAAVESNTTLKTRNISLRQGGNR